jgi:hypothetical protein
LKKALDFWIKYLKPLISSIINLGKFILRIGKAFIDWTLDYTGPLAGIVKAIPILLMAAFILFPFWTYPLWLWAGQGVGAPGNYVLYALWWLMLIASMTAAAVIGYYRESS